MNDMVYHRAIYTKVRAYIKYIANDNIKDVIAATGVSKVKIYRIHREPLGSKGKSTRKRGVIGRPRKQKNGDVRRIIREVFQL